MKSWTRAFIILSLVFVCVWACANIMVNRSNLPMTWTPGSAQRPQNQPAIPSSGHGPDASWVIYAMYGTVWVFIGLLIALLILAIITRNKHLLRSAIIYVAVLMLFVVMFIGGIDLVRFLRDNVSLLFTGSSSGTGGGGSSASGNPVTSLVLMTAIIAGLAITVAVLLAVRKKLKPKHHRKADRRLQAADVISRTIKELQRGDDFRLAIIRCYRRFCRLLGEHGIRKQDILTPRELEALAFERFRLKKTSLDKLTLLFEEARYSPHEISGDNRAEAVMCLHAIKTELEKAEATAWQS